MSSYRKTARNLLAAVVALAASTALAQDSKLTIGGTTYTKWLWGNQRYDGAMYNFTTVPGEGYGDNGQGTELELLIDAKLSRQVEVKGRIHSRFSQNQWTNFGGFGGALPADGESCTGGDCGEFDPRSNQYVKLRGMQVILTPGYQWIDQAVIGSNDFGQFDPNVIGRIRYIDRDNAQGLLFQGSALGRRLTWDAARISLPRLWAGPSFNTGDYPVQDATYGGQLKFTFSEMFDFGLIGQWTNDVEVSPTDPQPDDGRDLSWRFQNAVGGAKVGIHALGVLDVRGAVYYSWADSNPAANPNPDPSSEQAPTFFGINGYSPVPAGRRTDLTWYANAAVEDPLGVGLSVNAQAFSIGADYVSIMAARRESDVLLTEGHDSAWAFPGPSNASYGVFGGNATRIGYGGWSGTAQQVATINVDNEFTDFDEPMAETAIGWQGVTIVPVFASGPLEIRAEYSWITYDTNWQAWGDSTRDIDNSRYPGTESDSGVGHNFRSAYVPFQDRTTQIAVVNAKYGLDLLGGIDVFGKAKYIYETDKRLDDTKYLPYVDGACTADPTAGGCTGAERAGNQNTDSLYSNPPVITGAGGATGYQWKPFDSLSDDDRKLQYWNFQIGVGKQLRDDLYLAVTYVKYLADLQDGNTAFQAYNLHELASGDHDKNQVIVNAKYILAGVEFGLEGQYNWGTFKPDFGTGFVPQEATQADHDNLGVEVGSLGFRNRFGGWNSLEEREFTQYRLKAFMKAQF